MAKVKFGFKNAYYAKVTDEGYDTPVKFDGAVSITLSPAGDDVEFYADDNMYFGETVNNGYDGSLELALIPESFKKDILGEIEDENGVAFEDATAIASPFALLCEFTTDAGARKYAFYNCIASRPELTATTKSSSKEVQTETLAIKARPNNDGIVVAHTNESTTSEILTNWYTTVYAKEDTI